MRGTALKTSATDSAVKSADRVLDLLELIARANGQLSHGDVADALNIPKSSLSKLVKNLQARRYLAVSTSARRLELGPAFFELSRAALTSRELLAEAQIILEDLARVVEETSSLAILRGDESEIVATVLGPNRLVTHMRLGDRAPLHATSGGKVLLAFMSETEQHNYLTRGPLQRITENTILDPDRLKEELCSVRKSGFAYVNSEFTMGIRGIASPVFDAQGQVIGALTLAIPEIRFGTAVQALAETSLSKARALLEARLKRIA